MIKANLKTMYYSCRCKISMTRNNLLEVLWQMLKASDEIDLKPSLPVCSRGRDFISTSNEFQVIIFFFEHEFFS